MVCSWPIGSAWSPYACDSKASGTNQWRYKGNFQRKMETWLELDTSKLPPGTTMHRVANTAPGTYVIRPPSLSGGGHASNPGFSLPSLNVRPAVVGTGSWPASGP